MIPIKRMFERLESTKEDSDLAYFYDLLLLGELVTKTIALFLVSSLNEDNERTKYRHEHFLVRANAIGDYSKTIDDLLTGPSSQLLSSNLRDLEVKELSQRVSDGSWQYESLKLLDECLESFKIKHDKLNVKAPLIHCLKSSFILVPLPLHKEASDEKSTYQIIRSRSTLSGRSTCKRFFDSQGI